MVSILLGEIESPTDYQITKMRFMKIEHKDVIILYGC